MIIFRQYDDKDVAIKFVNYIENDHAQERENDHAQECENDHAQEREKNISTILDHENIIICYGYYRTTTPPRNINNDLPRKYRRHRGEQLVFVMEKADRDLEQYLQEHEDMSYQDRKNLIVQIVTGLVYLYNQHITLHDLKVYFKQYDMILN